MHHHAQRCEALEWDLSFGDLKWCGLLVFWVLSTWVSLVNCRCCCEIIDVFLSFMCFTFLRERCVNLDS